MRLERIGPYRIEEPLGTGGMGEVYRAHDDRLGRRVAIKVIRTDAAVSAERRERFRREARAVANLGHPAIVQVFDILKSEEGDSIVMELVEGVSLAAELAAGPMDLLRAARLGAEIAGGLAEAHRKGIIHRDLKAENVMVTPAGHAKILDFGIAKSLRPPSDEASLSMDDRVLGTCRAMSPEQASGLPVDARSDLFSLGSLLYQMVTGDHPFAAQNNLATLKRVVEHHPPSPNTARPDIPPELAELVNALLAKEPSMRPAGANAVAQALEQVAGALLLDSPSADTLSGISDVTVDLRGSRAGGGAARRRATFAVVAVLALVAGGLGYLRLRQPTAAEALRVAVPRPEVEGLEAAEAGMVAAALEVAAFTALASLDEIAPLDPATGLPEPAPPVETARALGADEVLTVRASCASRVCQVSLRRLRGADGSVLWPATFEAPADSPRVLASAVVAHLRRAYPGRAPRPGAEVLDVDGEDFARFLRLRQIFYERPPAADLENVLDALGEVRRASPRFVEGYLLEADVARHLFTQTRQPRYLDLALELAGRARELAPADPRPLDTLLRAALSAGDLERAEAAAAEMEALDPGDAIVLEARARLAERRGGVEEALGLMAEAARRRPTVRTLFNLADVEFRHGHTVAARRHLEELLQLSPGNFYGLSKLAQLELQAGEVARAEGLYAELAERSPSPTTRTNLGLARMLLGRYEEAARSFRHALEDGARTPAVLLNLADCTLLLGREEEARRLYLELLEKTAAAGDAGRDDWQTLLARGQSLAHLGRDRQAVEAAQQALRLAPEIPQAAYEAALIYALVGDRSSALVNAERALAGGVESRWFALPWFEELRREPELAGLLGESSSPP